MIDKLVAALQAALKDPDVQHEVHRARRRDRTRPTSRRRPRSQAHLKAEIDKWAPIIKKAGVYAD